MRPELGTEFGQALLVRAAGVKLVSGTVANSKTTILEAYRLPR